MKFSLRTIIVSALVIASAIGVVFAVRMPSREKDNGGSGSGSASPELGQAFSEASTTFGASDGTATTTPAEPTRWDATLIKSRHVAFTPPKGYWVYFNQGDLTYWLVKGDAPEPGSPDPVASAYEHRVAYIHAATWEHESFPTYERFETTMAQFDCAEGTSDENLTVCLSERKNERKGKTDVGLPMTTFALNAVLQQDQSPKGTRNFAIVRLGAENDNIIIVTATDQSEAAATNALAKSMRIQVD